MLARDRGDSADFYKPMPPMRARPEELSGRHHIVLDDTILLICRKSLFFIFGRPLYCFAPQRAHAIAATPPARPRAAPATGCRPPGHLRADAARRRAPLIYTAEIYRQNYRGQCRQMGIQ